MNERPRSPAIAPRSLARAIPAFLAFSILLSILVIVNGFSLQLALIFAFLSLFLVIAVRALLNSTTEAYLKKRREEELSGFLYRAIYHKSRDGSYFRAVDKAIEGTSHGGLKRTLAHASRSLKLGGGFISGMAAEGESKEGALLKNLRLEGTDDLAQVRTALSAHELYLSGRQSELEESSQRYATINMFISTIAPSFLVFAFIGSAILSQAGFSMLLLSVSLLILIPLFYSIGNSFLSRRIYA
jgi:hypothetical protein